MSDPTKFDDYRLNPRRELCARCGQVARGSGWANGKRYCHPNDLLAPDCYHIVTVVEASR